MLAIIYPTIRPGLLRRQPQQRANALLGWAAAPLGIGIFFTTLLFIPSLLNRLGIPAGHCHNHSERLPHICLTDPLFSGSEALPWYLVGALIFLLAGFLAVQGVHLYKIARLKIVLGCAASQSQAGYNLVPWRKPVALTVGFWAPQIFISTALAQALAPEHLQVILAHEQSHVRRRDPLRQYLGQVLSFCHLPWSRRCILEDLTLATEQVCDEEAAVNTGSRLQVAETILIVERLLYSSQNELGAGAVGFANSQSALRIESLLAEAEYKAPTFPGWVLFLPPAVLTSVVMPGPLHYLTELVVRH